MVIKRLLIVYITFMIQKIIINQFHIKKCSFSIKHIVFYCFINNFFKAFSNVNLQLNVDVMMYYTMIFR